MGFTGIDEEKSRDGRRSPSLFFRGICVMATVSYGDGESLSLFYQHYYRLPEGLYITYVAPGSDAEAKGIERGDILVSINDTRITTTQELSAILFNCKVGQTVTVVVYRGGYQYELQLMIAEDKG